MTAWFEISGESVAVWSIYTDPVKTVFAINFEWMHRSGKAVSADALERLADRLRPLPGVTALYSDLGERDYKKRPNIPANQLFTADDAAARIIEAVDELVGAGSSTDRRPPAT